MNRQKLEDFFRTLGCPVVLTEEVDPGDHIPKLTIVVPRRFLHFVRWYTRHEIGLGFLIDVRSMSVARRLTLKLKYQFHWRKDL